MGRSGRDARLACWFSGSLCVSGCLKLSSFPRRRESCSSFGGGGFCCLLLRLNQDSRLRGNDGKILFQKTFRICKPPPTFALCCSNFCTLGFAKVSTAFALYRMMRNKKSDATVAFYFTNYIRPILHWFYQFYFFRPYKPIQVE